MELYATGFNAHSQLRPQKTGAPVAAAASASEDLASFSPVLHAVSAPCKIWVALWSATVVEAEGELLHWGFNRFSQSNEPRNIEFGQGISLGSLKQVFGDISGVLGALSTEGDLFILKSQDAGMAFRRYEWDQGAFCKLNDLKIEHVGVAGSDEVCISARSGDGKEFALYVFSSFTSFLGATQPLKTFTMSGPVLALQASATSFTALLAEDRSVCTFGSALHPELLARTPTASMPADAPHPVEFLGGIPIQKIVTCEWLGAALSIDRDLYLWGGRRGEAERVAALPDSGEDVKLVDIMGGDILDVAIGMGHVMVLTAEGEIWGCGDNDYGQLGLENTDESFLKEWTKIPKVWEEKGRVISVMAGGWGSFVALKAEGVQATKPKDDPP